MGPVVKEGRGPGNMPGNKTLEHVHQLTESNVLGYIKHVVEIVSCVIKINPKIDTDFFLNNLYQMVQRFSRA